MKSNWFINYSKTFNTLTNQLWAQFVYCMVLTIIFSIKENIFAFSSDTSQYLAMIFHAASAYCLYILKSRLGRLDKFSIPKYIIIIYLLIIILIILASLFPPEYETYNYLIPYFISWVATIIGIIIWYFRNPRRNNGQVNQNEGDENVQNEAPNGQVNQNEGDENVQNEAPNGQVNQNEENNGGENGQNEVSNGQVDPNEHNGQEYKLDIIHND
ncbi:hypothetical protein C2G38_995732 [Gigaspora rosea]|uniref:Vacuolar membrane protease transmembrane domain-containing protein n=1 Tax=Gigaspora rosea TaxID=44941 RepID=A0A397WAQ6_9GLOM|nr:hypothetical protein C2G38_995732 [Gigaspora rosea]